jgi:ATP-dependent DNA ligase
MPRTLVLERAEGHPRHPSFKGLREDKPARQVTAERPSRV